MTPTTLRLSSLSRHLESQVRGQTDAATVKRYSQAMRSGAIFPPLLVANIEGAMVLADGFHRRAAMELLEIEEAPAVVVPCKTPEEAVWLGFDANLRHGQPLKPRMLRPAFRAFVKAGRHRKALRGFKSYREIAGELPGASYSAVRRWMQQDFPDVFRAMGESAGAGKGGLAGTIRPETILTREALALIDDAAAIMGGVVSSERRNRVAARMTEVARLMTLDSDYGGSADNPMF